MLQINFQVTDMEKGGMIGAAILMLVIPDPITISGYALMCFLWVFKAIFGATIGMFCTDMYKAGKSKFLDWYKNRK